MNDSLTVPENISFKQAIDLTQNLILQIDLGTLTDAQITEIISELVKTENGARGFFVTYLTADHSLADHPNDAIIAALRSHPESVAELLVKNVAMSAAQGVYHRRNNSEDAQGSARVQQRTIKLIELVDLPAVYEHSRQLLASATTGEGIYKDFLNRWGYDTEQRQVICQALQQVLSQA